MKMLIIAVLSCLSTLMFVEVALATTAVMVMYQNQDKPIELQKLAEVGCSAWRSGEITGSRGNLDIASLNQFVLLECKKTVVANKHNREVFESVFQKESHLRIYEGDFVQREKSFIQNDEALNRRYILKIGRFNNIDVAQRIDQHTEFMTVTRNLDNHFNIEANILVNRAYGDETPDSIEVFYYESMEASKQFSANNRPLIEASYVFNDKHFAEYVYFGGKITPLASVSLPLDKQLILKKGQLLSIVAPVVKDGGAAWRKVYETEAIDLAKSFGLTSEFSLKVVSSLQKDEPLQSLHLFSWPSEYAMQSLLHHPSWPEMIAMREKGWQSLDIYTAKMSDDSTVIFDPNKYYTIAIVWFSAEYPDYYDRYMAGIAEKVAEIGGKFLIKMRGPNIESLSEGIQTPGQITLVEWPNRKALGALFNSSVYQEHKQFLTKGATDIRFYGLSM